MDEQNMGGPGTSAQDLSDQFRAWILAQDVGGYRIHAEQATQLRVMSDAVRGEVNFYDMAPDPDIVEMRITRLADEQQTFFLHFMMDDLARAKELFAQMAEALLEMGATERVEVLLCCSCGITTSMFAGKMNQISDTLGLGYSFEARPFDAAVAGGKNYAAVMLAPQVSHMRARVTEVFPDAAVFEIPAKVYGAYDAAGGVRLVSHVLDRENTKSAGVPNHGGERLPMEGDLAYEGRIMVVSAVLGARLSTYEYRVYDNGEEILRGKSERRQFDFRDIEDLLASVRLQGVDVAGLDAIGISVPGIIDDDSVSLLSLDIHDYDLGAHVGKAFGTRVFLDNDANAAAAGCFATQKRYRSITYHREDFGHAGCGQGSIVDGRLVTGRKNFAGELNHIVDTFSFAGDPDDLAWTEDGLRQIVSRFLLCNICALAPEAIYVDAWPVTDMDELRAELVRFVDERYLPELIPAPDFNECVLLGELALCAQRLAG